MTNEKELSVDVSANQKEVYSNSAEASNPHVGHRQRVFARYAKDSDLDTFQPHEMLEMLLFAGIPRKDTNEIAHELIEKFGCLSTVFMTHPDELMKVKNMTKLAASIITCVVPLARHVEIDRVKRDVFLDYRKKALQHFKALFMNRNIEIMYIASLDISDRVLSTDQLSVGSSNMVIIDTRRAVEIACRHRANKVIIAHNHPAGNNKPSEQDIQLTTTLSYAFNAIGIEMVDHIIVTNTGYFSFNESGLLMKTLEKIDEVYNTNIASEKRARRNQDGTLLDNKDYL